LRRSQKQATGQYLIDQICQKLNLLEKEYFSCTYTKRDVKVTESRISVHGRFQVASFRKLIGLFSRIYTLHIYVQEMKHRFDVLRQNKTFII